MKDKLLKMIKAKEDMRAQRKAEFKKDMENAKNSTELRSLYTQCDKEMDQLDGEIKEYRSMVSELEEAEKRNKPDEDDPNIASKVPDGVDQQKRNADQVKEDPKDSQKRNFNVLNTYGYGANSNSTDKRAEELQARYEKRGQDLKDRKKVTFDIRRELPIARSITVASSNLVVPGQYSDQLNPTFNQVSSLIDLVHAVPMKGGETYTKGFKKPVTDLPDYTPEATQYKNVDSIWDKVTISKTYITDYTEISKQSIKLPNIDYQSQVGGDLRSALRRKISREILVGDGEAGHFVGIFNAPANVIPADSDLTIDKIDADTLDKIVFGYGGDEDVEGTAYLILNKNDLAKFATIRSSDGKKLYKIVVNGNTGTISSEDSFSVNFVLNSTCPAFSLDTTAAGSYCMAYGNLNNYEMPVFSDIDVEMSTDYKFGEGMVAYAGDVYSGGNVAAWKGFLRIKKGTVTP